MFDTVSRYRRYAVASAEDRCARRFEVSIPARLRPSGNQGFAVMVTDISIAGFSCEAVTSMPKGALCWIMLPGLTGLQSELIWNERGRLGCAFDRLLSPAVLDHLVARFR